MSEEEQFSAKLKAEKNLFKKLTLYGEALTHGFFVQDLIEEILHNAIIDFPETRKFFEQLSPLLVELRYLKPENADAQAVLALLRSYDTWLDMDAAEDVYDKRTKIVEAWKPVSDFCKMRREELLKDDEEGKAKTAAELDFLSGFPHHSDFELGNHQFHNLALDLTHLAYLKSIEVTAPETQGDQLTALMKEVARKNKEVKT